MQNGSRKQSTHFFLLKLYELSLCMFRRPARRENFKNSACNVSPNYKAHELRRDIQVERQLNQ